MLFSAVNIFMVTCKGPKLLQRLIFANLKFPYSLPHTAAPQPRQQRLRTCTISTCCLFSFLESSLWPSPPTASATVHRYFPQWMDFFVGLKTITKSLFQVWTLHTCCLLSLLCRLCCELLSNIVSHVSQRHHSQQQQPNKNTCIPERHPGQHQHRWWVVLSSTHRSTSSELEQLYHILLSPHVFLLLLDLTRAVNALPRNMTSQMFSAIAAVTGQGQNPNTTPAQWGSSQYGYGGSTGGGGGSSSAYHVSAAYNDEDDDDEEGKSLF